MSKGSELQAKFQKMFGVRPQVYRAPGRVNLIGEHTDYNDGFVFPAAIGFSCYVGIAPREDERLVIYSENFDEKIEASLELNALRRSGKWSDYPLGVARGVQQAGTRLRGANVYISGEIPLGAGLSSSAAMEVSTGYALLELWGASIDRTELALLCQRAENEFVGARCGIMDQFISCHGRTGHALLLDCRSLQYRLIRIPAGVQLVICNTMVRHEISASEYNVRRAQCEEGIRLLSETLPEIRALRDVSVEQLELNRSRLPETIYRRCRHIVTENDRVLRMVSAFESGEISAVRELMEGSHRSLMDDYEVSCPELDVMVELAWKQRGVFGARMTGGGFGGCTINLVDAADCAEFQRQVGSGYYSATGQRPDIYVCEAAQGAERVSCSG